MLKREVGFLRKLNHHSKVPGSIDGKKRKMTTDVKGECVDCGRKGLRLRKDCTVGPHDIRGGHVGHKCSGEGKLPTKYKIACPFCKTLHYCREVGLDFSVTKVMQVRVAMPRHRRSGCGTLCPGSGLSVTYDPESREIKI